MAFSSFLSCVGIDFFFFFFGFKMELMLIFASSICVRIYMEVDGHLYWDWL